MQYLLYDDIGNNHYQNLLLSEEYYLFNCDQEILQNKSNLIVDTFLKQNQEQTFNLIELGCGDGEKAEWII